MEDDDEIRSRPSPGTPPSGRITVTVAAAAPSSTATTPTPPVNQTTLALAFPIQRSGGSASGGGAGGGGREDCWSEGATSVLIDAWGERYVELSRGNLKQKHWQEVADVVSSREDYAKPPKTDIQCKNRIDTVKKKYKSEKSKVAAGSGPSRWPFYDRLDRLIGPTTAKVAPSVASTKAASAAVPVGIPVGVRTPLPFPISHYSPFMLQQQQQQHQQQQQLQHMRQNNFASPALYQKFNSNSNSNNNYNNASNLSLSNNSKLQNHNLHNQQQQFRRGPPIPLPIPPPDSDSEREEGWSPDSGNSLPPETSFERRKRPRVEMNNSNLGIGREKKERGKKEKGEMGKWGNSVRELTRAILKFGEAYEAAESAKLQQVVEMEKQRMKFAKELELQRIKFLMKTQLELSQLNGNGNSNGDSRGGGGGGVGTGGGGVGSNHHNHIENHLNHANSDSSN